MAWRVWSRQDYWRRQHIVTLCASHIAPDAQERQAELLSQKPLIPAQGRAGSVARGGNNPCPVAEHVAATVAAGCERAWRGVARRDGTAKGRMAGDSPARPRRAARPPREAEDSGAPADFRPLLDRADNGSLTKASYLPSSRPALEVVARMDVTDSDPAFAPLCISGDDALQLGEDMDELLGEDGDWADAPGATGTMVAVLEFERGDDGGDKGPFSGPPPACAGGTAASPQESAVKAALDVLGAVTLLVLFSPMLAAICLAVMLDSPGPPIFCQTRIGWRGRDFTIYKFRTMHAHAALACRQTERGDARCTRLGAFLRRTSLDEVPQLWNVIRGDMSLVGPRPHAEGLHREGPDRGDLVPWYDRRHQVKPGLTGWAQIHGARGAVRTQAEMCRRVSFDLYYIEHWSIWLDLRILARTPVIVLLGENAF